MSPLAAALLVLGLSAWAEGWHARRVARAARLAFGPEAAPRTWVRAVPFLRCLGFAAFAWGLATLFQLQQAQKEGRAPEPRQPPRLVFVADLSPSMFLKDAGPEGKQTRQARMRDAVESVLMRVGADVRFGVIGFYTDARPVVMDARDPELVRNVFNGLPVHYTMKSGSTDLATAVNAAVKLVAPLPEGSVRLLIFTDGDTIPLQPVAPRPASVKDVLVLGVGNPRKGTFIDGHQSRQDPEVLATLARSLRGSYYDLNEKQLPTVALGDLVVRAPLPRQGPDLARLAVWAMVAGALLLSLLPVALQYAGTRWRVVPAGSAEGAALR